MDDIHKKILEKFNSPSKELTTKKDQVELTQAEKNYESDYQFSRKKMRDLVSKGETAIAELLDVTLETKDPSAFKVLSELLTTVGNLSGKVIETARHKAEIDNKVNGGTPAIRTQNNAVFIGTAQDLLRTVEKEKEKEEQQGVIEAEIIE